MIRIRYLFKRLFAIKKLHPPQGAKFTIGQKVKCFATHEVVFSTVTDGAIMGFSHMAKSYWKFSEESGIWYFVKYRNGMLMVLPEERMEDIEEYISKMTSFLSEREEERDLVQLEARSRIMDHVWSAWHFLYYRYSCGGMFWLNLLYGINKENDIESVRGARKRVLEFRDAPDGYVKMFQDACDARIKMLEIALIEAGARKPEFFYGGEKSFYCDIAPKYKGESFARFVSYGESIEERFFNIEQEIKQLKKDK